MDLICWDLSGQRCIIKYKLTDPISQIKDRIGERLNIDAAAKRLAYNGEYLQNDKTMEDCMCAYGKNDVVYLVPGDTHMVTFGYGTGRSAVVELACFKPIGLIKAQLQYMFGIDPQYTILAHNHKELENGKTLEFYNYVEGQVINWSTRSPPPGAFITQFGASLDSQIDSLRFLIHMQPGMIRSMLQQLNVGYKQLLEFFTTPPTRCDALFIHLAQAKMRDSPGAATIARANDQPCTPVNIWKNNPTISELRGFLERDCTDFSNALFALGIGTSQLAWMIAPQADRFLQKLVAARKEAEKEK